MSRALLREVRPYGAGDPVDLLVEDGVIARIGASISAETENSFTAVTPLTR